MTNPDSETPAEKVHDTAEETLAETQSSGLQEVDETLIEPTQTEQAAFLSSAPTGEDQFASGGTAEQTTEILAGQFGRYRIEKLLGEGAMGAVYLAQDEQLGRPVALKVPKQSALSSANAVARFNREARSAATLSHPGICPVYDVGEYDGRLFLTMGYIEGRPLDVYVKRNKRQPERQVAAVVRKIATALEEAHRKGIIHRDLKPANIMIDQRSEPIVMDFGLARHTADESDAKLTREGAIMGSPAYMSPEQVRGESNLGPATDIYSLGVLLYELLTGTTPFQGNVASVIGQILHTEPAPVTEHREDVSDQLVAICHKAMAKVATDRFASMDAFASDLARFLSNKPIKAALTEQAAMSVEDAHTKRKEIVRLLKEKNFDKAVSGLTTLAELSSEATTEISTWASEKLHTIQQRQKEHEQNSQSLLRRARASLDKGEYDRTLELVNRIPHERLDQQAIDLKAEAADLAAEVATLNSILQEPDGIDDLELMEAVQRLLEIKPDHRLANDLYDDLRKQATRNRRSNSRIRRQSKRKKTGRNSATIAKVAILMVLVCLAAWLFLRQQDGARKKAEDGRGSQPSERSQDGPPGYNGSRDRQADVDGLPDDQQGDRPRPGDGGFDSRPGFRPRPPRPLDRLRNRLND